MRTTWVNHASRRYYSVFLIEDLFGDWTLIRSWSGQGSNRGSLRSTGVASYEDGVARIEAIAKRVGSMVTNASVCRKALLHRRRRTDPHRRSGCCPCRIRSRPCCGRSEALPGTLQQGIRLEAERDRNERVRAETVLAAQRGPRS